MNVTKILIDFEFVDEFVNNYSTSQFVTARHINDLTKGICLHCRSRKNSLDVSEAVLEESETDYDDIGEGNSKSYNIPDHLRTPGQIRQQLKSNLKKTSLTNEEIDKIVNNVSDSISDTLHEQLAEIEEAIKDENRSKIKDLSQIILTAVVSRFIDDIFNILAQHSDEVMHAIVETITTSIPW